MNFLNFFRWNKKTKASAEKIEEASLEQTFFAETVSEIIIPFLESKGFTKYSIIVKAYSANIVCRKGKQYVRINSTNYPTDYPYYYNIVLGEGDSEDIFEYDWNSVAVSAMAKIIDPAAVISCYDFPYGNNFRQSIEKANADLIKYGDTFLNGDMTIFYEARKFINEKREPYKIHTPDKQGNYTTTYESKSAEQKRKYS